MVKGTITRLYGAIELATFIAYNTYNVATLGCIDIVIAVSECMVRGTAATTAEKLEPTILGYANPTLSTLIDRIGKAGNWDTENLKFFVADLKTESDLAYTATK
jgi:hypothetical protein